MKKIFLALGLLLISSAAEAQTSRNPCYMNGAQSTNGIPSCESVSNTKPLPVVTVTTPGSPLDIEGNVASGVADSGNPVKIGGIFKSTLPTLVDGQRSDLQLNNSGGIIAASGVAAADGTTNTIALINRGIAGGTNNSAILGIAGYSFNGATWDRSYVCNSTAVINVTAGSTTEIVTLTASQIIRVCSFTASISITGTAQFVYGTGSNCGTGTTSITGAVPLATASPWAMSASGEGNNLFRTASANALCVAAVTGNVMGFVTYAKF